MRKHRGPILEHQTSTPVSLSDFSMENATNSSNLRFCLTVIQPRPPTGDCRSQAGAWEHLNSVPFRVMAGELDRCRVGRGEEPVAFETM